MYQESVRKKNVKWLRFKFMMLSAGAPGTRQRDWAIYEGRRFSFPPVAVEGLAEEHDVSHSYVDGICCKVDGVLRKEFRQAPTNEAIEKKRQHFFRYRGVSDRLKYSTKLIYWDIYLRRMVQTPPCRPIDLEKIYGICSSRISRIVNMVRNDVGLYQSDELLEGPKIWEEHMGMPSFEVGE